MSVQPQFQDTPHAELPAPVSRAPIHTRTIECRGFKRDDGLWDIEGELVDVKSYGFDNAFRGRIEAGVPLHGMRLRLTLDDDLTVREAHAASYATPYRLCPDIAPDFSVLAGLKIGPGWRKDVLARLGGVKGCTHLVELAIGALATAAIQTIGPLRARDPGKRPGHLDTCHALASDGEVVRERYPAFYTGAR
jgi:Protein of unknown function (DUF2889)